MGIESLEPGERLSMEFAIQEVADKILRDLDFDELDKQILKEAQKREDESLKKGGR